MLKRAYDEVAGHVSRAAEAIQADAAAGRPVVPEVDYRTIRDGDVSDATRAAIRRTGCVVVRGVFPPAMASAWFAELGDYLDANRYEEREVEKRSLDKYFSALKAGRPQIFNVYWSKPQVQARQDPRLAETRAFLNRLWRYDGVFDPDRECTYADRVRRRQPGDETLGLSPHMDAGTVERWIDPGFQQVYRNVFAGDWRAYDPFDAAHRLDTREIPVTRGVQHVPDVSGLDRADAPGTERWDAAADSHRRRNLLRAAARAAGRRGRDGSLRGRAWTCPWRQP